MSTGLPPHGFETSIVAVLELTDDSSPQIPAGIIGDVVDTLDMLKLAGDQQLEDEECDPDVHAENDMIRYARTSSGCFDSPYSCRIA